MDFKRRKKKRGSQDESVEPSKEETAVAKHLRWNCPTKSSTMMGNKVEYFIASKAVDCLLDSNWASGKKNTEILFTDRESVVDYLDRLLALGLFSHVVRIKKRKDKDKGKEKEKEKGKEKEKEKEKVKEKEQEKEKTEEGETKKSKKKEKKEKLEEGKKVLDYLLDYPDLLAWCEGVQADEEERQEELAKNVPETTTSEEGKKKRKVKVKLELHDDQYFMDGDEAYVWIYDPVHPKTFIMGILVVLATIAICLFPLWPHTVREYVWYLSVIAAIGVGMILVLAVLRYIIFGILWVLTWGRHKFWLLPNLTEECGFLESFQPLYTYEYCPGTSKEQSTEDQQNDQDEEDPKVKDDTEPSPTIEDERGSSEDKENGDRDSWVKLTEEEVEKAKTEMEGDVEIKEEGSSDHERTVDPVC